VFCEDHEALTLLARELVLPIEQIAHSGDISAPDSSTDLVELSKSEFFCIRDDDRIGSEEVHTVLYDCGRYEYIVFMLLKREDTIFDVVGVHLPVCRDNSWRSFCIVILSLRRIQVL
jgi:hypothetical protein